MNLASWIVLGAIAAWAAVALIYVIRHRGCGCSGGSGCGGSCGGCNGDCAHCGRHRMEESGKNSGKGARENP